MSAPPSECAGGMRCRRRLLSFANRSGRVASNSFKFRLVACFSDGEAVSSQCASGTLEKAFTNIPMSFAVCSPPLPAAAVGTCISFDVQSHDLTNREILKNVSTSRYSRRTNELRIIAASASPPPPPPPVTALSPSVGAHVALIAFKGVRFSCTLRLSNGFPLRVLWRCTGCTMRGGKNWWV